MKNLKAIFNLKSAAINKVLIAVGVVFIFSSCLKNKDSVYVDVPVAGLSIFHASPGTPTFNVAIGNTIINNGYYPIDIEYSKALSYVRVTPGLRDISVLKTNKDTIRTGSFRLDATKYYSLFVIDEAPSPNLLFVQDTIVTPTAGNARVRFANLSPDAGNLDLIVTSGTDTTVFANQAYKAVSAFTNLAGTKAYKIEIKEGTTSKAVLENVQIVDGRTYTIWAKGVSTATSDDLKTSLKVNQH